MPGLEHVAGKLTEDEVSFIVRPTIASTQERRHKARDWDGNASHLLPSKTNQGFNIRDLRTSCLERTCLINLSRNIVLDPIHVRADIFNSIDKGACLFFSAFPANRSHIEFSAWNGTARLSQVPQSKRQPAVRHGHGQEPLISVGLGTGSTGWWRPWDGDSGVAPGSKPIEIVSRQDGSRWIDYDRLFFLCTNCFLYVRFTAEVKTSCGSWPPKPPASVRQ